MGYAAGFFHDNDSVKGKGTKDTVFSILNSKPINRSKHEHFEKISIPARNTLAHFPNQSSNIHH